MRATEGGHVRIVRAFEATCLDDGKKAQLPLGTIGTVASLMMDSGLADVLFKHDGMFWLGANLFVARSPNDPDQLIGLRDDRGDVEPIDLVTAIGDLHDRPV